MLALMPLFINLRWITTSTSGFAVHEFRFIARGDARRAGVEASVGD